MIGCDWMQIQDSCILQQHVSMSCCEGEHDHEGHRREEVVEGMTEEEQARLKEQRKQKKMEQLNAYKSKYLPLLKFLQSNGLKFKEAAVKKHSVQYFRVDQFRQLLEKKKEAIEKNEKIKQLLENWEKIFVYYQRLSNQPHLKWPQHLQESKKGPESKFASFRFNSAESSRSLGALILVGVIALVLFPLWPYELKYFLWKLCLWLLIAICVLIVVRLVAYMFMAIFGVSFWIFPRFFDNCSTIESFKPFVSVEKWQGSNIYNVVTRLLIVSIFVYYGFHMYHDPGMLQENFDITQTIIDDINDWGIAKIKGQKNFSQSALTDYSKLLNETMKEAQDHHFDQTVEI